MRNLVANKQFTGDFNLDIMVCEPGIKQKHHTTQLFSVIGLLNDTVTFDQNSNRLAEGVLWCMYPPSKVYQPCVSIRKLNNSTTNSSTIYVSIIKIQFT